jgi:hypothetical protein
MPACSSDVLEVSRIKELDFLDGQTVCGILGLTAQLNAIYPRRIFHHCCGSVFDNPVGGT